jgi:CheY-like chemotaxis protein
LTGNSSFMTHDLGQLAVLVVDDNANMRKVVITLLATMGIKLVTEADSATAALLALHEQPFDVIITDLSMQPMNGIDLVRMVRMGRDSPNPHIPVIMLTGHTELDLVREARDVGIDEFVAKPVSVRGLYERLDAIATHPRPIVRSQRYVGPDRRAQRKSAHQGKERRRNRARLEDREKLL